VQTAHTHGNCILFWEEHGFMGFQGWRRGVEPLMMALTLGFEIGIDVAMSGLFSFLFPLSLRIAFACTVNGSLKATLWY
jgi:hypothetical protein